MTKEKKEYWGAVAIVAAVAAVGVIAGRVAWYMLTSPFIGYGPFGFSVLTASVAGLIVLWSLE